MYWYCGRFDFLLSSAGSIIVGLQDFRKFRNVFSYSAFFQIGTVKAPAAINFLAVLIKSVTIDFPSKPSVNFLNLGSHDFKGTFSPILAPVIRLRENNPAQQTRIPLIVVRINTFTTANSQPTVTIAPNRKRYEVGIKTSLTLFNRQDFIWWDWYIFLDESIPEVFRVFLADVIPDVGIRSKCSENGVMVTESTRVFSKFILLDMQNCSTSYRSCRKSS